MILQNTYENLDQLGKVNLVSITRYIGFIGEGKQSTQKKTDKLYHLKAHHGQESNSQTLFVMDNDCFYIAFC